MTTDVGILDEEQVLIQEDRWKAAIEAMDGLMPLWYHHAARLHLSMNRTWCSTAAVDGVSLFWNPEFTAELNDRELLFLLVHEVFHVAAGHIWRGARYQEGKQGRELQQINRRLNQAADYAIHQILVPLARRKDYRKMRFPTGKNRGLYDKRFTNMSMEKIYEFLLNNPDDKANGKSQSFDVHIFRGKGDPDGSGVPEGAQADEDGNWVMVVDGNGEPVAVAPGEMESGDAPVPEDPKQIQVAIKRDLKSSGYGKQPASSTTAGTGKGDTGREAQVTEVKDDWSILTQFVVMNAMADYAYRRPNRSYLSQGLIVPGLRSSTIDIVIAIDVSGSIDRTAFDLFASNVELIRKQIGDHTLTLIFCDDEIQKVEKYGHNEEIRWKVMGCGGTSFNPPFRWVADNMVDPPSCFVYFTDGCCGNARPQEAPDYPVLWALWGPKVEQPWGQNLKLAGT